ncbi:cellulase family glycosylhydrolase [Acidipila sp. EB88]|uniref:cellulase family glycosylhydrolase n=1 Tax=Acidipila sp. EB88 TaxID=2305226 RepID=UPI0013150787|nr:cellulase family glycosylhydrolase [Acidipila sp. EB88]
MPIRLSSVAWYGAETIESVVGGLQLEPLEAIAQRIRCLGFNAVRLPWSNQLYENSSFVPQYAIAANPALEGLTPLAVFSKVVQALTAQGLLVILDNHNSNAEWCCGDDGNDLWYNSDYPESSWIADWRGMVTRFLDNPRVIAVDLRNEPRIRATWGGNPTTDWHAAAERGAAAVLATNPNLLIMVEGINYSLDLTEVAALPIKLPVANRLVYSPHDYPFDHSNYASALDLAAQFDIAWGYIAVPDQPYTAPIWIGEFGNCHDTTNCISDTAPNSSGLWFASIRQYIQQKGISWDWWAINGTESGSLNPERLGGSEETYGVLNPAWNGPALPNETGAVSNVASALASIANPLPARGAVSPAPLVALASPTPGETVASGTSLTILPNVNVVAGGSDEVALVGLFVDDQPVAISIEAPYSLTWRDIPAGAHLLIVAALTWQGHIGLSQAIPVQGTNYETPHPPFTNSIGINFIGTDDEFMARTEIAGFVPQAYWNQAIAGILPDLIDRNGSNTPAVATWRSPYHYSINIPNIPGNNRMMRGYLDSSNTLPNSVSVSGLPASFAIYDVVVYFDGANAGSDSKPGPSRSSLYRLTSMGTDGVIHGCQEQKQEGSTIRGTDAGVDFSGTFTRASGGSTGNYVLFTDCTGSNFHLTSIHGQSTDDQVRAPVNGIQILAHH